jgi:hypothetical protein
MSADYETYLMAIVFSALAIAILLDFFDDNNGRFG